MLLAAAQVLLLAASMHIKRDEEVYKESIVVGIQRSGLGSHSGLQMRTTVRRRECRVAHDHLCSVHL